MAADRILLVVLDDGCVGRLLFIENDVEDRVQAVRAAERSERALWHHKCVWLLAPAV